MQERKVFLWLSERFQKYQPKIIWMYRRSVAVTGRYDRLRIENQEQGLRSKISWFYLSTILTKLCSYELDWVEFTEINWQFSLLCAMFILCLDRNFNAIYLMLSFFCLAVYLMRSFYLCVYLCKFHLSYIVLHVWYCKKVIENDVCALNSSI